MGRGWFVVVGDGPAGTHLAEEPDAGEGPVALDGAWRDVEDFGDLFDGEAAEIAKLDDASLAGVLGGELGEGLIDGGDFVEAVGGDGEVVVHLDTTETAGATLGIVLTGVVDEDLAHDVGGEADEVGAAVPVDVFADEAEIGFVDEGGSLEGVVGALATHVGLGETVELRVDEREETIGGGGVAVVHGLEELGYFSRVGIHQGWDQSGVLLLLHGTSKVGNAFRELCYLSFREIQTGRVAMLAAGAGWGRLLIPAGIRCAVPVVQMHTGEQRVGAAVKELQTDVGTYISQHGVVPHAECILSAVAAGIPSVDGDRGTRVGSDERGNRKDAVTIIAATRGQS